ncbi:MAG: HEAT repeat domain-containing protein [Acidobacteriota bacterium]
MITEAAGRGPEVLGWDECMRLLESLPAMSMDQRLGAIVRLARNPSPWIRQRALRVGASLLGEDQLVSYLRDDADDIVRNMGLEMLKLRGPQALSVAVKLLRDDDPDVVLQAIGILDHVKDVRALEPLRPCLRHSDQNVVQAAILAIGHLGDERVVPDLLAFLDGEAWLQIAAIQALGDLRSPAALRPLKKLLVDMFLGPLSAESIARIGGPQAFKILAEHWMAFHEQVDVEMMLGLLAHVMEGLPKPSPAPEGFEASLRPLIDDPAEPVRHAAARCLLALGPGVESEHALETVLAMEALSPEPHACLRYRTDLIPRLLSAEGIARQWGFQLLSRYPEAVSVEVIAQAVKGLGADEVTDEVVNALMTVDEPELAGELLRLYLRSDEEGRGKLMPALRSWKSLLKHVVAREAGIPVEKQIVLSALMGADPASVAGMIRDLASESRVEVIAELAYHKEVMKLLPWEEWLAEEPDAFVPAGCEVIAQSNYLELLPVMRSMLSRKVYDDIVEVMGEVGDREGVPVLERAMGSVNQFTRSLIMESLGRIGGPEARRVLRGMIGSPDPKEASMAYKSLSRCAIEEDLPVFKAAIGHKDWVTRLACVEALSRYPVPEHVRLLAALAADPVGAVAKRAVSCLES